MGSNNSAKLDDPAATALGSDTGLGSDRMREFYSKGKRDRFLFRLNGSIPYRSGFCTAIARFAGSFVIVNFDTGAYVSPQALCFRLLRRLGRSIAGSRTVRPVVEISHTHLI